ncbi:MAG: hypothetical protein H6721_02640 [Sandaracinus sp.]|nr:hypothetical protein [Sandaracinus sp.]MCB9631031.1 hypothetical protein [Sandaracinus sp.]
MYEMLFHHGWWFPWLLAGVAAAAVRLTPRRRIAPSWQPASRDFGPVVLDGRLEAPWRLPGGHLVAPSGANGGRCVLRRPDGTSLALVGPLLPLAAIPRHESDVPRRTALTPGCDVRVRASLVPAPASSGDPVGYRDVTCSLQLVPRDDDGFIEISRRRPPRRWPWAALAGLAVGLLLPGLGLTVGYDELGFASPLFRHAAMGTIADQIEERLRDGEGSALEVERFLLLRNALRLPACEEGPPSGSSLEAIRRFAELCRRPAWLPAAVEARWTRLAPGELHRWLRELERRDVVPESLVPVAARLQWVFDGEVSTASPLPELVRDSLGSLAPLDAFLAGERDALAPTLLRAPDETEPAYRLGALALAGCGTPEALPECEKAFEGFVVSESAFSDAHQRELLRWGPMLSQVHARTNGRAMHPRVEHALVERVVSFHMMVRDDARLLDEVRRARDRLSVLREEDAAGGDYRKRWCLKPRQCHVEAREPLQNRLPEIAIWLGDRALVDAALVPGDVHDLWLRNTRRQVDPMPWETPQPDWRAWLGSLDAQDQTVAAQTRDPQPFTRCDAPERVPSSLDLLAYLDSRRLWRARCGESHEHDRWMALLSAEYRGARAMGFARLEAAFGELAPILPHLETPPPPEDTRTEFVRTPKPDAPSWDGPWLLALPPLDGRPFSRVTWPDDAEPPGTNHAR